MRPIRVPFERVIAPENLRGAWLDFRRGKRGRRSVRAFAVDVHQNLSRLHQLLESDRYQPSGFRLRIIREPKVRLIAAAPVVDRIVHHALYRALAPWVDPSLCDTTYACLPGRGTHRALLKFLWAQRHYRYRLLLDVRHYFLSIRHEVLLGWWARRVRDPRIVELARRIIDSGDGLYHAVVSDGRSSTGFTRVHEALSLAEGFPPPRTGIPIGNLTSQWWANHYLGAFDHFVQRELRIPHYQRYMDDLALFSDDPKELEAARVPIMQWLESERGLRLKHPNASVESTERGVDYLGYHVRRKGVFPLSATLRRFEHRVAETTGFSADEDVDRVVASFRGVLMFPHSMKGWARPRHADLPVDFEVLPEERAGTEWSPDSG